MSATSRRSCRGVVLGAVVTALLAATSCSSGSSGRASTTVAVTTTTVPESASPSFVLAASPKAAEAFTGRAMKVQSGGKPVKPAAEVTVHAPCNLTATGTGLRVRDFAAVDGSYTFMSQSTVEAATSDLAKGFVTGVDLVPATCHSKDGPTSITYTADAGLEASLRQALPDGITLSARRVDATQVGYSPGRYTLVLLASGPHVAVLGLAGIPPVKLVSYVRSLVSG